jgi:LacI family transcriptional regulator
MHKQRSANVTIFDVAREAGVSYSTVSRVINNYEFVKPDTQEKVRAAMEKLGYVANLKARSLAGGRSQVIGLLVFDFENSYQIGIIKGIDDEASALGYDLMLATTHGRKERSYITQLTNGLVEGLLILVPRSLDAYVEDLQKQNFPYVLIDHQGISAQDNTVNAANYQGAYDATKYLIDLGHRRIGMIAGPLDNIDSASDRLKGYEAAIADFEISAAEELVCSGDYFEQIGADCMNNLLALSRPPTAVFCSSDLLAIGAMKAISDRNLRVPEDISIVGFDDVPEASYTTPGLTTVKQPLNEIGRVATRVLRDAIESHEFMPQQIVLTTQLVERKSCTAPYGSVFYDAANS